jgi:hypothetical protein
MNRRATATAGRNARRTRARQSKEILSDRFEIRNISTAKQSYPPGGTVTVTVEYGSESDTPQFPGTIDLDHPDNCEFQPILGTKGANLVPVASVNGGTTNSGDEGCWDPTNTNSIFDDVEVAAPPTEGTTSVNVELIGANTKQVYSSATRQINVTDRASGETETGDDGNGDNGDDECGFVDQLLGTCEDGGGDSPLLGTEQTIALAAFAILVIVAVSATQ